MNFICRTASRCAVSVCQKMWRAPVSPSVLASVETKDISGIKTPAYRGQGNLLLPALQSFVPIRSYKARNVLKLRCADCYFVKRQGRMFVECKTHPRHKQMSIIGRHKLYRDDYSKGKYWEQVYAKYREERYYKMGGEKYIKYNWLGDRLGKDL